MGVQLLVFLCACLGLFLDRLGRVKKTEEGGGGAWGSGVGGGATVAFWR